MKLNAFDEERPIVRTVILVLILIGVVIFAFNAPRLLGYELRPDIDPKGEEIGRVTENKRCLTPSKDFKKHLGSKIVAEGESRVRFIRAIKINDGFLVAGEIQAEGIESSREYGVWKASQLERDGQIFSIDKFAESFSKWKRHSHRVAPGFGKEDYRLALRCSQNLIEKKK